MKPGNEPGEDFDIRKVHGALLRETAEPMEAFRAAPWWLKHCIYAPLCIWGIWYLTVYSGGFAWNEYNEKFTRTYVPGEVADSGAGKQTTTAVTRPSNDSATLIAEGKTVFSKVCAACHQANGQGLPGAFPPLAGSDWVAGPEEQLILPVLHGLNGEIVVNGETWNGAMPAQATLDDRQVAAVLSYVRSAWGNSAPPVMPEAVTDLRETYKDHPAWTAADLEAVLAGENGAN